MRSLSKKTQALLRGLKESYWLNGSEGEKARHLAAIAESHEVAAVPSLVEFLYSPKRAVSEAAAMAIDRLVQVAVPMELVQLDLMVRGISDWQSLPPSLADITDLAHGFTRTLGVLSFHGNGRVRQAAVRRLNLSHEGIELPFLLLRLNDWVEPVREEAKHGVMQRIRPEYAAYFIRSLPLVQRLECQHRDDHRLIVRLVLDLLRNPLSQSALMSAVRSSDRQTCQTAFRFLAQVVGVNAIATFEQCAASGDPVIRFWSARELIKRLSGEQLREFLLRIENDKFLPIRREALYGYAERLPELSLERLNRALLDPHASMREVARFYLRRSGDVDFASIYSSHLHAADPKQLAAAISGLGEVGTKDDAVKLVPFLRHENARVRRAAVRAIGHLDAEHFVSELLAALEDEHARVVKAARDVLSSRPQLLDRQRLWTNFKRLTTEHGHKAILLLIANLQWWDSAPLLVLAAGSGDDAVKSLALGFFARWRRNCGRLTTRPSEQQLTLLEEAMGRHRGLLDKVTAADLDVHLDYVRRAKATGA